MKQHLIYLFFLCAVSMSYAQQSAQYTSYMLDPMRYNPAYAGLEDALSFTGTYRQQWAGLEGAPQSARASIHMPLYFLSGGFGLQFENEQLGAHNFTLAKAAYNYQKDLGLGVFSIGLAAGMQQFRLNGQDLTTPDGSYLGPGIISHNDDLLSFSEVSGSSAVFDAGLFFKTDRLNVGLSVENASQASISLNELDYELLSSYHIFAAYEFELGQRFVLKPSAWFKSDAVQHQLDLSVLTQYNDNILTGLSFRGYNTSTTDALALFFGFNVSKSLAVVYAYDIALSPLQSFHSGSHEIVVKYHLAQSIGAGKPPRIIYHPRM